MTSHGVVHFEIPAEDPDKLSQFYTQLFGWRIDKMSMGGADVPDYYVTSTVEVDERGMPRQPGAINGGIYKRQSPDDRAINYVNVESVDQYVEKAKGLGARVVVDKMPVPGMGYFAQLMDPEGNPFGVWEGNSEAA
jgi:predicted enzyme related to lactoylglutathione lyase